jgi:LmbE family N-acetylglucosaminyl deacetylase
MHPLLTEAERLMVIMAHPDDAEIQCGGTVARLVAAGKKLTYLLCTSGNRGGTELGLTTEGLAAIREAEQQAAASVLGVEEVIFLCHDDGDLAFMLPKLRRQLAALLRQHRPQVVFTHDPFAGLGSYEICYLHPDHRAVGEAVVQAAFFCAPGPLFYPEQLADGLAPHKPAALCLAMSDRPDLFVDIGETFEAKVAAIACHASQWGQQADLAGVFRQMAEGAGRERGLPLAEAFKVLNG